MEIPYYVLIPLNLLLIAGIIAWAAYVCRRNNK